MAPPVRLTSESELRALFIETLLNQTTKVSKVSDNSVLAGIAAANAKIAKKGLKDIALAVSHIFPDSASGATLDVIADNHGIAPRLGASQSSTYIRVVGQPGTIYTQGVQTVFGNNGIVFDVMETITIGSKGYAYVKIRSQQTGEITNVDPYTIVNVNPIPTGHVSLINEYRATGGRDIEQDDVFRERIKQGSDILARGTLSYLTQAFIKINPDVLKVNYEGIDQNGKVVLSIVTQNGMDLTSFELDELLTQGAQYLSLSDLNPIGTISYGVKLKNVDYYAIDVSMRLQIFDNFTIDDIVKDIQVQFSKYVDFRFWDSSTDTIQWDILLSIVRNTSGVKRVLDTYFTPNADITVPVGKLPKFRGFVVYDLAGNVLINQSGTLNPVLYPSEVDNVFEITVL